MKRLPALIAPFVASALLAVVPSARAQVEEATQLFDEGNGAFESGEFGRAIQKYESAIATGFESGALHTNLGSAYYRMDRLGLAMYHYQRALALTPEGRELRHNIQILQPALRDQFSRLPEPIWTRWRRAIVRAVGLGWLFFIGMLLWLSACTLIVLRTVGRNPAAWLARTIPAQITVGVLIMVLAVAASVVEERHVRAVVISQEADLSEESAGAVRASVRVHEGLVVDVIESEDGRVLARLPNGITGWISSEALRVL